MIIKSTHSVKIIISSIQLFAVFLFSLLVIPTTYSQIRIDKANDLELNPENLVKNVFIGNGVKIESVHFQGANKAIGSFRNGLNDIGLDRGIVISTGEVDSLATANHSKSTSSSTSQKTVSDSDLESISGSSLSDLAIVTIKFRPIDDVIGFNFVFGSEEYPESVCSEFNDVFAFFIDGPNPNGGQYVSKNIALIPDPNNPDDGTFTDFPVTINSVNNGQIGPDSLGDCSNPGESLDFSTFFNSNDSSKTFTLDGFLDVLRAQVDVLPCEEYTLKLAIGDAFDDAFDSAVFLEAKSFTSANHTVLVDAPGVDYTMLEGCDPTIVEIKRTGESDETIEVNFEIIDGPNSAIQGIDYTINENQINISSGQQSSKLIITPLLDELQEGEEVVYLVFKNAECFRDTLKINILDQSIPDFTITEDIFLCEGERVILDDNGNFTQLKIFEKSGNFEIGNPDRDDCRSTIIVEDLDIEYLNEASFVQVCIDQLEHNMLSDMEIFLVSPSGLVLELSTNNGEDGGNGDGLDQYINTCFTVNAQNLINGGNQEEGTFLSSNPTYTGNFSPEQDFEELFGGFYSPIKGRWSLIIKDDVNEQFRGTLFQWSLKFNPKNSEIKNYAINGVADMSSTLIITEDTEITELINNNYGCLFSSQAKIEFTPLPLPPSPACSSPRRNQIFLEWANSDIVEYEININDGQWQVLQNVSEYLIENLDLNTEYNIKIRSVKNGCLGEVETFLCTTPPCANSEIIVDQISPTSSACIDDGVIQVSVSNDEGPYRYSINDESNSNNQFQNLAIGQYKIMATDIYGCTFSKNLNVEGLAPLEISMESRKVSCDLEVRGTALAHVSGGQAPFSYIWSNGGTGSALTKIEKGRYTVTVTDAFGCIQTNEVEIEEGDIPSVEYEKIDVQCFGEPTGEAQMHAIGGDGPYDYTWDDGYKTTLSHRSGLEAGLYTVTVNDANRCFTFTEIEINEPEEFITSFEKEDNTCFGAEIGNATINIQGGTAPYETVWSTRDTTRSIKNLKAGAYRVTITDAHGCKSSNNVQISEPQETSILFNENPITCHKGENGTITAEVQGGQGNYTYQWDNGQSQQTINNLSKGTYCVTATSENECRVIHCYKIDEPPPINVGISTTDITCYENTDGALLIEVNGGTPPYNIELNGELVQPTENGNVTGLRSGTYLVKIIDNTGCSTSKVVELEEATAPTLFPEVRHLDCVGDDSGAIFMRYQNEPNAEIKWTDDNGNEYEGRNLTNLKSGNYHYEILARRGCILTGTIEVREPDMPLQLNVESTHISCFDKRDATITLQGEGGSGRYFYSLNGRGFQRSGTYEGLRSGTYGTFIKDENDCTVQGDSIIITEPEHFEITLQGDTTLEVGEDLEIMYDLMNGQGELMYEWEITSEQEISCLSCENVYVNNISSDFLLSVVVKDENLCITEDHLQVYVIKNYQIHVPTGFSPNGDGRNEILNVFGPEFALVKEFNIYLRNGINIYNEYNFRPNNPSNGWDGTFKSKKMPAGIYIWTMLVEYDDGVRQSFKGSVQLIR